MTDIAKLSETPLVAMLTEMLEEARSGQISSAAVAVVASDGTIGSTWSAPTIEKCATLLGSVAWLQVRLASDMTSRPRGSMKP